MTYLKEDAMKSPFALLMSLLTDVNRLERGVKDLEKDIIRLKNRYEEEGLGFLTVALPSLGKALDRGLADGKLTCPLGFLRTPRGTLPRLFSGLFSKIFCNKTGYLKDNIDVGTVVSLRDILYLFKKACPSEARDDRLDILAKTGFWKCDDEVQEFLTPEINHCLTSVSRFVLRNISDDLSEYLPKHGPGSVFEGCTPNQKWLEVLQAVSKDDARIREYGYDTLLSGSFQNGETLVDFGTYRPRSESILEDGFLTQSSCGVAKLVTVPKSNTSKRTITVEPVVNQFLQQGLNRYLRSSIRRCTVLRHCLALSDQGKNQQLAVIGSLTGEWSTIDLSSASDLLGCELVKTVFGHRPRLLEALMAVRTPKVYRDGNPCILRKFAGMGNATTFPVQSVVFAVIAITASLISRGLPFTYRNVVLTARSVRVYGDDIIVRTQHYRHVADWLSRCGLRLNAAKTFSTGNFRESCGVDAYLGVEVTPVYAKTLPGITSKGPDLLADMVSLRNAMRYKGYYRAAYRVEKYVESLFGTLPYVTHDMLQKFDGGHRKAVPVARSDMGCLGWVERRRLFSFGRLDPSLQVHVLRAPVIVGSFRKDPVGGHAALIKCLTTPLISREDPKHLDQSVQRFKSKIRWRWVPSKEGQVVYH
jgi:hypothetical protein